MPSFFRTNNLISTVLLLACCLSLYAETHNPPPCSDPWVCDYKPVIGGTIDGPDSPCHDQAQTYKIKETSADGQRSHCGITDPVHASPIAWSWSLSGPETDSGIGNSFEHTFKQAGTYTITYTGRASTEGPTCDAPDNAIATKEVTIAKDSAAATIADATGCVGETVPLKWTITNTGTCQSTFNWLAYALDGDPTVTVAPQTGSIKLGPGASGSNTIMAAIAKDSPRGQKTIHFEVDTSVTQGVVKTTGKVTVPFPSAKGRVTDQVACVGDSIEVPFSISNTGTCAEDYSWSFRALSNEIVIVNQGLPAPPKHINAGATFSGKVRVAVAGPIPANGFATIELKVSSPPLGQVDVTTGKVNMSISPHLLVDKSAIAAGGIHSAVHSTPVTIQLSCPNAVGSMVSVSLINGGGGSDNSGTWWWNMPAIPASLAIGGTIIHPGDVPVQLPVNGLIKGTLFSSNKIESTTILVSVTNGGTDQKKVSFEKANFQANIPVSPVNVWTDFTANITYKGLQVDGHVVRLAISKVILNDGTSVEPSLGDSQATSQSLAGYVELDPDAVFLHNFYQVTVSNKIPSISTQCRVLDERVKTIIITEYDMSVEDGK